MLRSNEMLKEFTSSWVLGMALFSGIVVLMFGQRPELQAPPGEGPTKIQVVGHALTWTPATILAYRMVRGVRHEDPKAPTPDGRRSPPEDPRA